MTINSAELFERLPLLKAQNNPEAGLRLLAQAHEDTRPDLSDFLSWVVKYMGELRKKANGPPRLHVVESGTMADEIRRRPK